MTTNNEPYYGSLGHTAQLMRVKSDEADVIEFSIFRVRQRAKGRRSCSSRIWLLKRFVSGALVRVRITAEALAELLALETVPLKLIRCEYLWATAKHRSSSREKPEAVAQQRA